MRGLDTNVLVRFLVQDDPKQAARATAVIESALSSGETLFLNHIVLCETVWVLESAYEISKADVADVLDRLMLTPQVSFEDKEEARTALSEYRVGKGDFADYLIGEVNSRSGCLETVTFDRDLGGSTRFKLF